MRSKEEACDYRYFPEPDLPDFKVQRELIEREKDSLEELPDKRRERFIKEYGFSKKESSLLIENKDLADFFEEALNFYNQPKKIHKLLFGPFLEQVKLLKEGLRAVKISAGDFAKVVKYFDQKKINNLGVKKVLALAIAGKKDVDRIIEAEGLVQISDEKGIEEVAEKVLAANLKAAQEYKQGKIQAIKFLIGQVMKETRGRANPQLVKKILERGLKE
jgi:aspartyl-tRNA(Asn)/glutamyl-tRNA(Gln) amidotransferase subunit B